MELIDELGGFRNQRDHHTATDHLHLAVEGTGILTASERGNFITVPEAHDEGRRA